MQKYEVHFNRAGEKKYADNYTSDKVRFGYVQYAM